MANCYFCCHGNVQAIDRHIFTVTFIPYMVVLHIRAHIFPIEVIHSLERNCHGNAASPVSFEHLNVSEFCIATFSGESTDTSTIA